LEYYFRDVSIGFAALDLSDQAYRLHIGVFFGILHGTLNHLLLTDRLWLKRLTDEGDHPNHLNAILGGHMAAAANPTGLGTCFRVGLPGLARQP
jgi:hypothetical protein